MRDVGVVTIDVCAPQGGGLDRYMVDGSGEVELTETPSEGLKQATRLLIALWVVAWIAVPLAAASRFGGAGAAIGCVIVLVVGVWLGSQLDPERRLKRGHDGSHWVEIRTRIEDSD